MLEVKGSYLYENGRLFFWLGDTAWLLFHKLDKEEIKKYFKQRKELGFNVIQCVLIHSIKEDYKNSYLRKEYWEMVKEMIAYAKTLGLYIGLLPAWGSLVKEGILNCENALRYAEFLNESFKELDNIIWILGGDIRGDVNVSFYQMLGKSLKTYHPKRLITFHPFGRTGSYQWFSNEDWLDFNMFQSGHRRYDQINMNSFDEKKENEEFYGEDNYRYVMKNKEYVPLKPCLDGEPSYEGILQGLHNPNEPYWEAKDIRRYAYWSILEGACGFTYGNNAVMQFYNGKEQGSYGVRET